MPRDFLCAGKCPIKTYIDNFKLFLSSNSDQQHPAWRLWIGCGKFEHSVNKCSVAMGGHMPDVNHLSYLNRFLKQWLYYCNIKLGAT